MLQHVLPLNSKEKVFFYITFSLVTSLVWTLFAMVSTSLSLVSSTFFCFLKSWIPFRRVWRTDGQVLAWLKDQAIPFVSPAHGDVVNNCVKCSDDQFVLTITITVWVFLAVSYKPEPTVIPSGLLVVEQYTWKNLVTGQPVLRIKTTGYAFIHLKTKYWTCLVRWVHGRVLFTLLVRCYPKYTPFRRMGLRYYLPLFSRPQSVLVIVEKMYVLLNRVVRFMRWYNQLYWLS